MRTQKIKHILIDSAEIRLEDGKFICLPGDRRPTRTAGGGLLGKVQDYLKGMGNLYYALLGLFSPVYAGRSTRLLKKILSQYDTKGIILNIGSGPKRLMQREDIINLDFFAFDEVDIVADATNIPIRDGSVDLIINLALLEHIPNPTAVIREIERLLKPGGAVFCFVPFMQPFHAAPEDYYRWTYKGAKALFEGFDNLQVTVVQGPASSFLWLSIEFWAILLSFGSKTLHDIIFLSLMVIASPLKLLDGLLLRFPNAEKIAGGFCITATKRGDG
jgi:SAM-dependent methyltransferase